RFLRALWDDRGCVDFTEAEWCQGSEDQTQAAQGARPGVRPGFGSDVREEFLSFVLIGEALRANNAREWATWGHRPCSRKKETFLWGVGGAVSGGRGVSASCEPRRSAGPPALPSPATPARVLPPARRSAPESRPPAIPATAPASRADRQGSARPGDAP